MAWLETNSYNSVVEKLGNINNGSSKFNEETRKEAEALLKDETINQKQRDEIQAHLDVYATLKTSVNTEKEATKELVEKNATVLINKLQELSKDNKSISKIDGKLIASIEKQLDYLEENNVEEYAKLLQQLSITSTQYRNFVNEGYTEKLPHFEKLIISEKEKLIGFLTESALDLDSKDLSQRLALYSGSKNKTKQKVILDHIMKNEIDNKNYTIQTSTDNNFNVLDSNNNKVENKEIQEIKKYISASDIQSYEIYKQTVDYKLLNQVSLGVDANGNNNTVADIINSSPESVRSKLTDLTVIKLLPFIGIVSYLFGFIGGKDKDGNKTSFMSRFGKVLLWGAALGLTATTINELWGNTWSLIRSAKNWIDEFWDTIFDWVSNIYNQVTEWAENTLNNNPALKKTYTSLIEADKNNPTPVGKQNIENLFRACSIDKIFENVAPSTIEWFVNNNDNIIAKQIWLEIPTKEDWKEYSNSELRNFLALLLTKKDHSDTYGSDLLILKDEPTQSTNNENTTESTNITPVSSNIENTSQEELESVEKKKLNNNTSEANIDSQEEIEKLNIFVTVAQIIDGRHYLFSEDGKSEFLDYSQLSPGISDILHDYETTKLKADNLLFILNIVEIKWKDVLLKKLYNSINGVNPLDIENTVAWLNTTINDILNQLPGNVGNIWKRKDALNYLTENGYYDAVSREIVNHNFDEIVWEITPKDLENFYNYYTVTPQIEHALKSIPDFEEKLRNTKNDLEWYISKFKAEIISQPQFAWIDQNTIIDQTRKNFLEGYSKSLLFEWAVANEITYWIFESSQNNETDLFAELEWIGWFDISEKNADFWWEEALMFIGTQIVATAAWLVTVWAWAVAVNALVYGARWAKVANYIAKSGRIVNWVTKVASAATSWAAFNLGYTWLNSVVEWKNLYTTEWFVDSAIGWIAFRAAWKVFESLKPALKTSGKFVLKHPVITSLSTAWLWVVWYNTIPESIQLDPGEWSQEEILEATTLIITLILAKKGHNAFKNYRATKAENGIKVDAIKRWEQFETKYRWEKFHAKYNTAKEKAKQNIVNRYSNMKNVKPKI